MYVCQQKSMGTGGLERGADQTAKAEQAHKRTLASSLLESGLTFLGAACKFATNGLE